MTQDTEASSEYGSEASPRDTTRHHSMTADPPARAPLDPRQRVAGRCLRLFNPLHYRSRPSQRTGSGHPAPARRGGAILRHALEPYRQRRFIRPLLGPHARPPMMIQWAYRDR